LALIILVDAAPWVMALCATVTLPAVYDFVLNPSAGLILTDEGLNWHSGRRAASVSLQEIDYVRVDTRLDFSKRVTLVLNSKKRVRLPYESIPSLNQLEPALTARGLRVDRHYFRLM